MAPTIAAQAISLPSSDGPRCARRCIHAHTASTPRSPMLRRPTLGVIGNTDVQLPTTTPQAVSPHKTTLPPHLSESPFLDSRRDGRQSTPIPCLTPGRAGFTLTRVFRPWESPSRRWLPKMVRSASYSGPHLVDERNPDGLHLSQTQTSQLAMTCTRSSGKNRGHRFHTHYSITPEPVYGDSNRTSRRAEYTPRTVPVGAFTFGANARVFGLVTRCPCMPATFTSVPLERYLRHKVSLLLYPYQYIPGRLII